MIQSKNRAEPVVSLPGFCYSIKVHAPRTTCQNRRRSRLILFLEHRFFFMAR